MWEYLERAAHSKPQTRHHTQPISEVFNFDFPRQLSSLETIAVKKRLHDRLSNHTKHNEILSIHESISDKAEFERRLRQYLYRRNKSEVMNAIKKVEVSPRRHYRGVSLEQGVASAPSWMKNNNRIIGLPTIDINRGNQPEALENLNIIVESGGKPIKKRKLLISHSKV